MASSFDALPPEMVQKCVEFLDFDLVSGDLKAVSKATRGVARRALTRGRWKPFRYVAAEGLAFCTPARPVEDLRHTFDHGTGQLWTWQMALLPILHAVCLGGGT